MLGNMHKMAAPSVLPSGYFIGPYLLNQSSDFNFVFTVILRKRFLFHTKFVDFGRSSPLIIYHIPFLFLLSGRTLVTSSKVHPITKGLLICISEFNFLKSEF